MAAKEIFPRVLKDDRGVLQVIDPLPFTAVRAFLITDVPFDKERGAHAHRTGTQLITCVRGWFRVLIEAFADGSAERMQKMWPMTAGRSILVPPMHLITLYDFSNSAACSVLCDEPYSTPLTESQWIQISNEQDSIS